MTNLETIHDFINEVRLRLDIKSYSMPSFDAVEIVPFLNQAQLRVIKRKLFGNPSDPRNYFTGDPQITKELENLMEYEVGLMASTYLNRVNTYQVDLPNNFYIYITSYTIGNRIIPNGKSANNFVYQHTMIPKSDYTKYVNKTGLHKPDFEDLKVWLENNKLIVLKDDYATIDGESHSTEVHYFRTPREFSIDEDGQITDLHYTLYDSIINETVLLLSINTESSRSEGQAVINQTQD